MRRRFALGAMAAVLCLAWMAPALAQGGNGQVHGTVFDAQRKGVPGLTIALIAENGSTIVGTNTDESGRYAFRRLAAGYYTVVLRDPGVGIARKDRLRVRPVFRSIIDFNVPADFEGHTIPQLVPEASPEAADDAEAAIFLTGTVLDVDGDPVPDASVTITPFDTGGSLGRARTDHSGYCRIPLTAGTYRMVVSAPGFMTWSLAPVPLDGSGALSLTVVLLRFPMGFEGTIEDLLLPQDPIPPEASDEEEPAQGGGR